MIIELNQFISILDTNHYPIGFTTRWPQLQHFMSTLKTIREQVNSQQNNENQVVTVYGDINKEIIDFIAEVQ
ncbi:hypothetical protein THII_3958 [Thioploca ingrica]|uniref:Uncharacterized protein n=1 Tax=Thioploca ingrica TaxID=40754 RepID=A0A090AR66_9GAMM|nr:hypothetical protein THII_3958 [Thioploca ingrica]